MNQESPRTSEQGMTRRQFVGIVAIVASVAGGSGLLRLTEALEKNFDPESVSWMLDSRNAMNSMLWPHKLHYLDGATESVSTIDVSDIMPSDGGINPRIREILNNLVVKPPGIFGVNLDDFINSLIQHSPTKIEVRQTRTYPDTSYEIDISFYNNSGKLIGHINANSSSNDNDFTSNITATSDSTFIDETFYDTQSFISIETNMPVIVPWTVDDIPNDGLFLPAGYTGDQNPHPGQTLYLSVPPFEYQGQTVSEVVIGSMKSNDTVKACIIPLLPEGGVVPVWSYPEELNSLPADLASQIKNIEITIQKPNRGNHHYPHGGITLKRKEQQTV